jgi:two-component system nitrate/nitrite response regulator NarL
MAGRRVRVVIVEDHPLYRYAIEQALERESDLQIVGSAEGGPEALATIRRLCPEVVLLDLTLSSSDGLSVLRDVGRDGMTRVLVLSADSDPKTVYAAFERGARGYLVKDVDAAALVEAIEAVAAGETVLPRKLQRGVIEEIGRHGRDREPTLTDRERDVLALAASGASRTEIAKRLFVSQATVKSDLASVYRKLRVSDRAAAVAEAIRRGFIHLD